MKVIVQSVLSLSALLYTSCIEDFPYEAPPMSSPSISITSPSQDEGVIGFRKNTNIHLKGLIEDDIGINQVRVYMINQVTGENLDPDADAERITAQTYTLDQQIFIPENARLGEYRLTIIATDFDGNEGKDVIYVRIL